MDMSVQRHLLSGEHVVWDGRPATGLILQPLDIFLIPFSVIWGGFALSLAANTWMASPLDWSSLFLLLFVGTAIYLTVGRFWIDIWIRCRTSYAVTNIRILILRNGRIPSLKSLDIKRLPALELHERSDGYGTIKFGTFGGFFGSTNFGTWSPAMDPVPQFIRIPEARSVYALIQRLAQ